MGHVPFHHPGLTSFLQVAKEGTDKMPNPKIKTNNFHKLPICLIKYKHCLSAGFHLTSNSVLVNWPIFRWHRVWMLLRHNNQMVSLSYNLCLLRCPVYPYWVDSGLGTSIHDMFAVWLKSCRSQSSRLAGSRFARHLEKNNAVRQLEKVLGNVNDLSPID